MKTATIIHIFWINLLTGGLCTPTCTGFGDGLITRNEGRVTLQVKVKEEIEEIQWIRHETHNIFFHIVNSCTFQKCCCQIEDPKNCCRIENKIYETKLCSCDISSLSSSITFCNLTREDEGWVSADIHAKNNQNTRCKFNLHIPEENVQPTEPSDNTWLKIFIGFVCFAVITAIVLAIICREKIKSWCTREREHDEAAVFHRCPTS